LPRRKLTLLLTPIVVLTVAGTLADWFAAAIITEHPLLQMFLNPRLRYLTLASNQVDPFPFFAMGFFRLVLTDPLYYLLGLWYGDAALRWMERHGGQSGRAVRVIERWFAKAAYPIVAIAPNGFVCLIAGATGMRPVVFLALNVTGTIVRLVAVRALAAAFQAPLETLLGFIGRYQWWVVGVSVALGLFEWWRGRRAGRSRIKSPGQIEQELAEAQVEVEEEVSIGTATRTADG
jgi:membrane protein DedA with SNARE-associated domain